MCIGCILLLILVAGLAGLLLAFPRTRKLARFVWVGVACLFLLFLAKSIRNGMGYAKVQRGDTREQVIRSLGQPDAIRPAWPYIGWDTDESLHKNNGECVEEFLYFSVFTVRCWWVGFDKDGKVNAKYSAVSY